MTDRRSAIASVPASATPAEARAAVGANAADPRGGEQSHDGQRWGSAATDLQRINLYLADGGRELFWNARYVLDGIFATEAAQQRLLPAQFANRLSVAAAALLDAAEELAPRFLVELSLSQDGDQLSIYDRQVPLPVEAVRLDLATLAAGAWQGRERLESESCQRLEQAAARLVDAWQALPQSTRMRLELRTCVPAESSA